MITVNKNVGKSTVFFVKQKQFSKKNLLVNDIHGM